MCKYSSAKSLSAHQQKQYYQIGRRAKDGALASQGQFDLHSFLVAMQIFRAEHAMPTSYLILSSCNLRPTMFVVIFAPFSSLLLSRVRQMRAMLAA